MIFAEKHITLFRENSSPGIIKVSIMAKRKTKEAEKAGGPAKEPISKDIVESYIFSTVRHNFGIYSERLMIRLVEYAQNEIRGLDFKGKSDLRKIEIGGLEEAEITIPVKDILSGEDDKNYAKAKEAVRGLMSKFIEYEDENTYKATQVLNEVDVDKVAGKMVIRVNRNVWGAMLDFSKGFRKYELETATKLRGKYSLRIYKLISKQKTPITYSIEELRKMWGLAEKYKKPDDFVRCTIVAAKEELDRVSPYSFDYILSYSRNAEVNKGRRGRPSATSVTFYPIHRVGNESTDSVRRQVDPSLLVGHEAYNLLTNKFGFDAMGIRANSTLFDVAQKNCDLVEFLYSISANALRAANIQGYVVNALRRYLSDKFGITVEGNIVLTDPTTVVPNQDKRSGKKEPSSLSDIFGKHAVEEIDTEEG